MKNEINNVIFEIIYYLINVLINLITRKLIIHSIDIEIVAVNHLLNQVINVFTLVEFEIYNIFLHNLYSAIKENNKIKIGSIMLQF